MQSRSVDRAPRIMTAALSRRRALQGAAGSAALALAGGIPSGSRRARAATVAAEASPLLDLSYAALAPSELSDGDRLGLVRGISYRTAGGGVEGRVLNERMVQALASSLDHLAGGHYSLIGPLDGSTDLQVTTELMEFANTGQARAALDAIATGYFAGTTEVPSDSERDRFFTWSAAQSGGANFAIRAVVSRAANVVVVVTVIQELADGDEAPTPEDVLAELEALRRPVALRLRTVLEPETPALVTTLPSVAEFGANASDGFTFGIFAWQQAYFMREGLPIRQTFQSDELFELFQQGFPGVEEAFFRGELPRTLEGNQLQVVLEAYRHADEESAAANFDNLEAFIAERTEVPPTFAARAIDPPPGLPDDLPSLFFTYAFDQDTAQQLGVIGWFRFGPDVLNLLVAGPPRAPELNEDPAFIAALGQFVVIGVNVYTGWNAGEGIRRADFERMQEICPNVDAALAG